MKKLIGRKNGMEQLYNKFGNIVTVTKIKINPCIIIDYRTKKDNGYDAVQLGTENKKIKNVTKAIIGHCQKKLGKTIEYNDKYVPKIIREFRIKEDEHSLDIGKLIEVDVFNIGEFVDIIGTTKGRGFQGVVKRYGFRGGRASHGGGLGRKPGSVGCCATPSNIYKGRKMPGHMGNNRRTILNIRIEKIEQDKGLLYVKGSIPGPNNGIVLIRLSNYINK